MDNRDIARVIEAIAVARNAAHVRTEDAQNAGAVFRASCFGAFLPAIPDAKTALAALEAVTSRKSRLHHAPLTAIHSNRRPELR